MSSTCRPSCFSRVCNPATRNAEGPISTPRRLAPRSIGTPIMRILSGIFLFSRPQDGEGPLRINSIEHPWEGDDLANVLRSAYPRDGAFQTQAEAGMRHAAVTPQIQIPLKRFLGQIVFAQASHQRVVIRQALAAADNFAVAFGRDHIE